MNSLIGRYCYGEAVAYFLLSYEVKFHRICLSWAGCLLQGAKGNQDLPWPEMNEED